MTLRVASRDLRLYGLFLRPSWLSAFVAVLVGCGVIGGTILLTHVGGTVRQSLLGLHGAYDKTSFGNSVGALNARLTNSALLNNALLFLLWGSVGLVVYSIVQGGMAELKGANALLRQLKYVNSDRRGILIHAGGRAAVRIVAFGLWWVLLRLLIYKLFPYAIVAAHTTAFHFASPSDWERCVLAAAGCMVSIQGLAALARLSMLRPRLFGREAGT